MIIINMGYYVVHPSFLTGTVSVDISFEKKNCLPFEIFHFLSGKIGLSARKGFKSELMVTPS